jgi:hypothetical protein
MTLYTVHGLQIDSEVPLPGLLPGSNQHSDVRIRYDSVPTALPNPLGEGGWFQAAPDTFLLDVRDVARFLVVKGQDILIERLPNCQEDVLRLYLLGSAFGALLHQRGLLVMHASTIQTARGAVLFVGPSGHGKSTLLAGLVQRGYAMLSDDVTAISLESPSSPVAYSAFPRLRLCSDAAVRLKYPVERLQRVRTWDADKYHVPVTCFCPKPLPVCAVYTLRVHATPDILLEPVSSVQRFAIVATNTYRYRFLEGLGQRQIHFKAATRLAKAVHVGSIIRPASPYMLDELVDRLSVEFGEPVDTAKEKEVSW